jgi:hypothetical protein
VERVLFALVDGIDENAEYVREAASPMNFSNIMIPGPLQAEHVTSKSQLDQPHHCCHRRCRCRNSMAPSLTLLTRTPWDSVTGSRRGLAALDPAVSILFQFVALPPVAGAVRPPVLTFIIKAGLNVGQQLLRACYCLDLQGHRKIVVCPCKLRWVCTFSNL